MEDELNDNTKVALHSVPKRTRAGYLCFRWRWYVVVVGKNPHGPNGGSCGNVLDGYVYARFTKYADALNCVGELVKEKGYIF
jgi:hypothetical protein